jgi:hypothetical protein
MLMLISVRGAILTALIITVVRVLVVPPENYPNLTSLLLIVITQNYRNPCAKITSRCIV